MKHTANESSATAALAVIGGSGFDRFAELQSCATLSVDTPYGPVTSIVQGMLGAKPVVFLPRHGPQHAVPPHRINYRANIWALKQMNVPRVLAVNAVGGISANMSPGTIVIPHQIVDYTYGREHTFFDGGAAGGRAATAVGIDSSQSAAAAFSPLRHIDFTHPYDPAWRAELVNHLRDSGQFVIDSAVYACTQGPRLETAAEIQRLRRDGADIVGMTGMPETALARELDIPYASMSVVVNWAAGIGDKAITMEAILAVMDSAMVAVKGAIQRLVASL